MPITGEVKEKVVVTSHPGGVRGAMMSLDEVAKKMWASRNDPRVRSWATQQLAKAGNPTGSRDRAQAIVEAYRKKVPYVPDPVQTEFMAGPVQTLCLDDHGVCIIGGDCDDAAITVGALLLSIGIPVQVVGASYKEPTDQPAHVYIQFQDDAGEWVPVDPTTKYEVGNVHEPARTWIVEPNKGVGSAGLPGGDFVGVGRAPQRAPWQGIASLPAGVGAALPRGGSGVRPTTSAPPSSPPGSSWPFPAPPLANCVQRAPLGGGPQSLRDYYEDPLHGGRARVMLGPRAVMVSEWGALAYSGKQLGLGLVTPGDVLSYRATWDRYVVDTVGVCLSCSQSFTTLSTTETDASTKAWLVAYAATLQTQGNSLLSMWNLYANTESSFIVLEGSSILQSFQETVIAAGKVRANITSGPLPCVLTYVNSSGQFVQAMPAADPSVQEQVIARIEGLGILAEGVLQILVESGANGLQATGSAAQFAARQVGKVVEALATPGPWIAITAVAGAVIVYELWR